MRISDYTKKIIAMSAVLLLVIIVMSVALYNQGPRVRFIQGLENVENSTLTSSSSLQIVFDRPIQQQDYTELIEISPAIDFTTQTNTQSITLTLLANLRSDTSYSVTVAPEIYDKSGKKMKQGYEHVFMTALARYAFLERNYGLQEVADAGTTTLYEDADDHVKIASVGAEPEIVFSHPEIRSFAANDRFVVVAVAEETRDDVYTINLQTNEVRKEQLWSSIRVTNLALGARSATALFSSRPDFSSVSPEYYEEFANRVQSLSLVDGSISLLTNVEDEPLEAFSVSVDVNGQIALINDSQQTFFAVSPFNDFEPAPLGKYQETFGFTSDGAEIVFRDNNELVRYDIASAAATPINLSDTSYVIDMQFKDGAASYSTADYDRGVSSSNVERLSGWDLDPEVIWQSTSTDSSSIARKVAPSYDNAQIALQFNPEKCQYDGLGINSECKDVFQQLIDPESGAVLRKFSGFNLIWIP